MFETRGGMEGEDAVDTSDGGGGVMSSTWLDAIRFGFIEPAANVDDAPFVIRWITGDVVAMAKSLGDDTDFGRRG